MVVLPKSVVSFVMVGGSFIEDTDCPNVGAAGCPKLNTDDACGAAVPAPPDAPNITGAAAAAAEGFGAVVIELLVLRGAGANPNPVLCAVVVGC